VASAKEAKPDYLDQAGVRIRQALQKEAERDYQAAFSHYRSGVDLLLQGVQGTAGGAAVHITSVDTL